MKLGTWCWICTRSLSVLLASVLLWGAVLAADWPQWRGPRREGISPETGLLKQWPEGGPPVVWQADHVGVGYSSLAVVGDRIYTQGDLDGVEHILCLDAKDGSVVWAVPPKGLAEKLEATVAAEMERLDANGDAVVDEVEALNAFGARFAAFETPAGDDPEALAQQRADRLFKILDQNADGAISLVEAPRGLGEIFAMVDQADPNADNKALAERRTVEVLQAFDKDNDGQVSLREVRDSALSRAFNRIDRRAPGERRGDGQLSSEELQDYFARREGGRDGRLSKAEFVEYYQRRHPGCDGILTRDELRTYYGGYRNGAGDGPRGTPTIDDGRLYAEGGNGDVSCLDAASGKTIWHLNLVDDLGGRIPGWGYSESPLIEKDLVIVTPGGSRGTVAALNKYTGEVVWRSSAVTQGAQYSSPVAADICGVHQIVQFARESVFGVTAGGGKALWSYSHPCNSTANVSTPIAFQDYVFAASAYGTGGGLARIVPQGAGQKAEEVYFEKKMQNHHGGVVRVGDYLYGFGSGGLICMDFSTGQIAWTDRSVTKGSLIVADGMLYCLGERYQMALVEATHEGYREHGRFGIENLGRPSWTHPVVANGRLYIRNQQRLTAYDIKASPSKP